MSQNQNEPNSVPIKMYKDVLAELKAEKSKNTRLEEQVLADNEILKRFKTEKDVDDKAKRDNALATITALTKGKLNEDNLKDETTESILNRIDTIQLIAPANAISVMRQIEEDAQKSKPKQYPGPGTYDQNTGTWIGGVA
jgi:hypothetical protein